MPTRGDKVKALIACKKKDYFNKLSKEEQLSEFEFELGKRMVIEITKAGKAYKIKDEDWDKLPLHIAEGITRTLMVKYYQHTTEFTKRRKELRNFLQQWNISLNETSSKS